MNTTTILTNFIERPTVKSVSEVSPTTRGPTLNLLFQLGASPIGSYKTFLLVKSLTSGSRLSSASTDQPRILARANNDLLC